MTGKRSSQRQAVAGTERSCRCCDAADGARRR
jgi:hypothetical protein